MKGRKIQRQNTNTTNIDINNPINICFMPKKKEKKFQEEHKKRRTLYMKNLGSVLVFWPDSVHNTRFDIQLD